MLTLGLVVNVGILLADRYQRLRRARPHTPPALLVLLAIRNRLRPLWATTLTAIVGMVPVLFLSGTEPFWRGPRDHRDRRPPLLRPPRPGRHGGTARLARAGD